MPLPTVESDPAGACRGVGLEAVLAGDPTDPRMAWAQSADGSRIDLVWPPYHRAVFAPTLAILAPDRSVVLREGERITGGCVTSDPSVLLVMPPFR